jgi:hypothetical protein
MGTAMKHARTCVGSGGEKDPDERVEGERRKRQDARGEANGRIDKREQEEVEATKVDRTRDRKDRRGQEE